jgi:hypothetical protein
MYRYLDSETSVLEFSVLNLWLYNIEGKALKLSETHFYIHTMRKRILTP